MAPKKRQRTERAGPATTSIHAVPRIKTTTLDILDKAWELRGWVPPPEGAAVVGDPALPWPFEHGGPKCVACSSRVCLIHAAWRKVLPGMTHSERGQIGDAFAHARYS
eukprot:15469960-Alexandrium_andersonii.AAC.1